MGEMERLIRRYTGGTSEGRESRVHPCERRVGTMMVSVSVQVPY